MRFDPGQAIRGVAAQEDARRQDSQEGYWFGQGPMMGVVPASDLRCIAQAGTVEPDSVDILCWDVGPFGVPITTGSKAAPLTAACKSI